MKKCPKCGEGISDNNSKFCPKCGFEIEINETKDNKVDGASEVINQVVTQAKIEKNYIKYRLEDTDKTQVKSDKFIISEKIVNAIDNITKDKEKRDK